MYRRLKEIRKSLLIERLEIKQSAILPPFSIACLCHQARLHITEYILINGTLK